MSHQSPTTWRQFSCPDNDLIHVQRAFLAAASDADPTHFCQQPISDADAHCVIGDVTADVIAACAMFTNCRMSATMFERFSHHNNCTGPSQPRVYLHVEYNCLSGIYNNTNIILITAKLFFTFDVSISIRDLRQKKLFNSSSGSCHGGDVTWQEIDRTYGSVYSCPRPCS